MRWTEKIIAYNNRIKLAPGARNVAGNNDYQGTRFALERTASFLDAGTEYEIMKEKFSFLTKVLEIIPTSMKQMI